MHGWGLITSSQLLKNYLLRFGQVAVPNELRTCIYRRFLRR